MIKESDRIGILGSGGQADEAESYLPFHLKPAGFRAVNAEYLDGIREDVINIQDASEKHINSPIVAAIGAPAVREALIRQWPGERYVSVVSEHAIVDESSEISDGCIVAPRAVITTNVKVGEHSIINVAATISHDSKLGSFVTVGPGAHIGGGVTLGDGVFVGIGASIKNGLSIAEGVVIGAGAVVVKDINEKNSVYVGVPAKKISENEGWLREV